MTVQEKRKGRGGKLSRSETVTVRLDPKLRYLAELAARKQRRTLSSFIEWAIEDSLNRVYLDNHTSVADMADYLWDVDEPDRFAKLALSYEYMLTHEEQVLWKLIREIGHIWRGTHDSNGEWTWRIDKGALVWDRLRQYWEAFKKVARGEADRSILPKAFAKPLKTTAPKTTAETNDFDDDIPF